MAVLHEYQWLVVVGAFAAFGFGWGTGANDVANAFATSVGSKTLTLKQAVIIAAIFEFAGALLLGRVSTNVIAGGIADVSSFLDAPAVYAYGMVCALSVGTIWLTITSALGLNVSSTHSIIGGIMGFALVWGGADAIVWAVRDPGAFPPYKGMVSIIMAWFIAPLLTGAASAFFLFTLRSLVLRRKNAFMITFWLLPALVTVTVWICMYFVFTKGAKKALSSGDWTDAKAAWVSAVIAVGCGLLAAVLGVPLLKRMASRYFDADGKRIVQMTDAYTVEDAAAKQNLDSEGGINKMPVDAIDAAANTTATGAKVPGKSWAAKIYGAGMHGVNVDIHKAVQKDARVGAMHERAEVYEERVEHAFSYLQVFSACCVIFAHGAGEVGYMAGPLATIWDVYTKGTLSKSVNPKIWVILIGALGLVIGLATYGYNVTRAMGVKLAKLTPSRGFCAELATAFVIMIAAQYGLPTSSSQCITGAIVGVGLLEGTGGVNWRVFAKQFASWVATLFVVGGFTAALFAQGIYAPSKPDFEALTVYRSQVGNLTQTLYRDFNTSLVAYQAAAATGATSQLTPTQWQSLYRSVNSTSVGLRPILDPRVRPATRPAVVMNALYKALALYRQNTVFTLGQNNVYPGARACNSANVSQINSNTLVSCPAPQFMNRAYNTSFP